MNLSNLVPVKANTRKDGTSALKSSSSKSAGKNAAIDLYYYGTSAGKENNNTASFRFSKAITSKFNLKNGKGLEILSNEELTSIAFKVVDSENATIYGKARTIKQEDGTEVEAKKSSRFTSSVLETVLINTGVITKGTACNVKIQDITENGEIYLTLATSTSTEVVADSPVETTTDNETAPNTFAMSDESL